MATFIFDNDISFRVAHALNLLVGDGHTCTALRDEFEKNIPDEEWIPIVSERGWVIISKDFRQQQNRVQHQGIRTSDARALYIRCGRTPYPLYADAARIIGAWPKILNWALNSEPGSIVQLTTENSIKDILPPPEETQDEPDPDPSI